jgi:hypothetical protein
LRAGVWRALLNAAASYQLITKAPIGRVPNPQPAGRSGICPASEIRALQQGAEARGRWALALGIGIAYDRALSPVDVRSIALRNVLGAGKDLWERHFRLTREVVMPGDTRVMLDLRRTAKVEADIGGMSRKDRAELLANNRDKSAFLEATYTPSTVVKSRQSLSKRVKAQALTEADAKG